MTGAELRASREAWGLSPEQLAEEFVCSAAQIMAWEAVPNEVACREFPGMLDSAMETAEVLFDKKRQEEFDAVMARAKEALARSTAALKAA